MARYERILFLNQPKRLTDIIYVYGSKALVERSSEKVLEVKSDHIFDVFFMFEVSHSGSRLPKHFSK